MSNNVHALPTQKASGRRRVRPLPDVPRADVLAIADHIESKHSETPEEQIERLNDTITEIVRHLLGAVDAIQKLRG